jgi:uncharacterized membrane protein
MSLCRYILISGTAGVVAWMGLGFAAPRPLLAVFFLTLGNYAIASPDVIIDATVAQRSLTHPRLAADLQALCWGALGVGGLVATTFVAPMYEAVCAHGLFIAIALTAAAIVLPVLLRFLPEKRDVAAHGCRGALAACSPALSSPLRGPVSAAAVPLNGQTGVGCADAGCTDAGGGRPVSPPADGRFSSSRSWCAHSRWG